MQSFALPCYIFHLGPWCLPQHAILFSLCSSLSMTDQVSN
jgi:hypothetical protein